MIAIDGRALLESAPGGIQTVARELIHALLVQSRDMRVVVPTRKISQDVHARSLIIRRSNRVALMRHALGIGEAFDDLIARVTGVWPDVVFAPTLQPLCITRAALVLVVHDCSFFRHPSWMVGKDRWWHQLLRPRRVIEAASAIICPSESTRQELEHFVPAVQSRIAVIPWGAPMKDEGRSSMDEVRRTGYKIDDTRYKSPYVLAIGTKHRRKNPDLLVHLNRFLAGMDPPHELVTIDPSRAISEEKKWQLLAGARALIYPSFYEGFGIPPLEAMAAGVPVIAALSSSVVEVVGNAGMLVSPYAPEQWEQILFVVLTDLALRQLLIARGRERISQFSWQRCAKEVMEVLLRESRI